MPLLFRPGACALISALLVAAASATNERTAPAVRPDLATAVGTIVEATLAEFRGDNLRADQFAITVVDLADQAHIEQGSFRGSVPIYPASVAKLFYLAATHAWLEEGRIVDHAELQRAMRDMIIDSSNDATSYVVDVLTGTTSGPELPEPELARWFGQRNAVNRYFARLGYTDINVNKKPWGDGPYGRETQATRRFEPKRNALTTDATARLLAEIARGTCVSAERSRKMLELLARDSAHPDEQAAFIHAALPTGARQWSKAGWTSQTRHIAAYVELPNGTRFVLVAFTTEHARNKAILPAIARHVVQAFGG